MKNINCILCNSDDKSIIAKQNFDDEYLSLVNPELNKTDRSWVECNNCKFIYHDPRLDEMEVDVLYKNYRDPSFTLENADEYFHRITSLPDSKSDNFHKVSYLNQVIPDHLNKGGSILDIGSGGGVFLYSFSQLKSSWSLFGVEPTPEFANLARRKLGCSIYNGNYKKDIFDTKFELITCNHVLEHTTNPIEFLSNIYSDLSHGGYLYLEVPDAIDFNELPETHNRFMMEHLWYFSKPILERLFIDIGFKIVNIESLKTIRDMNDIVSVLFKE